jgi:hypothetical protein
MTEPIQAAKPKMKWKDIPTILAGILLIFFLLAGAAYFFVLNGFSKKKKTPEKEKIQNLNRIMLPYLLSAATIIVSLLDFEWRTCIVLCMGTTAVLYLAIRSLRMAHNPLRFMDPILDGWIKSEGGWLKNLLKNRIKESPEMSPSIKSLLIPAVVTQKEFRSMLIERMAGDPRILLFAFVIQYVFSLVFTLLVFAAMMRVDVSLVSHSFLHDILGSVLRFFSGSELDGFYDSRHVSKWILGFESVMNFYYLVVAIMTFGVVVPFHSKRLKDTVETLVNKEVLQLQMEFPIETLVPNNSEPKK